MYDELQGTGTGFHNSKVVTNTLKIVFYLCTKQVENFLFWPDVTLSNTTATVILAISHVARSLILHVFHMQMIFIHFLMTSAHLQTEL